MAEPEIQQLQLVKPIALDQKERVIEKVQYYVDRATQEFGKSFAAVEVKFDLIGSTAGMYLMRKDYRVIRFNPYLFAKYFEDNLASTVPHEVAHYVVERLYGVRHVRPHGAEWRAVMRFFGVAPKVRCHYDLTGIPQRIQRRFDYACLCRTHRITTRRHFAIQKAKQRYACRVCGEELVLGNVI